MACSADAVPAIRTRRRFAEMQSLAPAGRSQQRLDALAELEDD